jgi:hypothetical protein
MSRSFFLAFLLVSPTLHADVYVWSDKDGRRQISDVVPPQYQAKARKVEVPDMPAPPPTEDLRSAAAGGSAAPAVEGDCAAQWQRYDESRECLAFYEYALRGLDADPRANCPLAAAPQGCATPAMGISSK